MWCWKLNMRLLCFSRVHILLLLLLVIIIIILFFFFYNISVFLLFLMILTRSNVRFVCLNRVQMEGGAELYRTQQAPFFSSAEVNLLTGGFPVQTLQTGLISRSLAGLKWVEPKRSCDAYSWTRSQSGGWGGGKDPVSSLAGLRRGFLNESDLISSN